MENKNLYDLTIIGGGAQATAFIAALYSYFNKNASDRILKISLIDKITNFGCGNVYNKDYPWILMNTPSTDLSVIKNMPNDFKSWVEDNYQKFELNISQLEYLPRSVFGYYLSERLDNFIEQLKYKNILISKINNIAKNINYNEKENFVEITLNNNDIIYSSYAVLAKGHEESNDPYCLKGKKNYIHNPFPANKNISHIEKNSSIGIIGSNLTGIDIAITLKELGHSKIFMFSRNGRLPEVKGKFLKSEKTKFVSFENYNNMHKNINKKLALKDLMKLVRKEFSLHQLDWRKVFFEKTPGYSEEKTFLERVRVAKNEPTTFNIILGMIPEIAKTWSIVEESEINKFMTLFYNKIHQKHGAIPLINAEKIANMLVEKKLILKNEITKIEEKENSFEVIFPNERIKCDYIINASGPNRRVCIADNSHLLSKLCQKNSIKEIDIGGIVTDVSNGEILKKNGKKLNRIRAIGHNTEGSHPFINNFAWILESTEVVALSLIHEVLYGKI